MTDARWLRLEALFNEIVELPPEGRSGALDARCGGDVALRRDLERLLDAHGRDDSGVRGVVDRAFGDDPTDPGGADVVAGPYTLVRRLGEGGMGAVWLARRSDDVHAAEVAVKLLKRAALDNETAQRFRTERRILAELNHPGIARLLDGGTTDAGVPYFVMEYVQGRPIDEYCAAEGLSPRAILELFRRVCDAVAFAHGRLVVHRDLKPGNILVTRGGEPKLLDFGIAKLLDTESAGMDVGVTRTGFRPMTPRYASPEQVRGETVSTSTDVYALGVLLYELLTGGSPYPDPGKANRSLEDAILGHTPTAPSVALATTLSATASGRERDIAARMLRGDLDTIVLKALQKDPHRRYASVEQLSEDLGRHLSGLPVRARPDTFAYRAGKFVRRNRGAVLSGALSFVVISALALASAWQSVLLARERDTLRVERDRATAVSSFLVDVFEAADPNEAQGLDITARTILSNGKARAREDLADDPSVQSAVLEAIGSVYAKLGDYDSADTLWTAAVEETRRLFGETSLEYATALLDLGGLRALQARFDEAEPALRTALQIRTERLGPDDEATAAVWNALGAQYALRSDPTQAERHLLEALRIFHDAHGDGDPTTLGVLSSLSVLYGMMGRREDAIETSRRVLAGQRSLRVGDHTLLAQAIANLGFALSGAGRNEEAVEFIAEALQMYERLLPPGHPDILKVRNNLAVSYRRLGRFDEAESLLRDVVAVLRTQSEPYILGRTLGNLGTAVLQGGHPAQAEPTLIEALTILRGLVGPDHPLLAPVLIDLANARRELGRFGESEAGFLEGRRILAGGGGAPDVTATLLRDYASLLLDLGRSSEAAGLVAQAEPLFATSLPSDHPERLSFDLVHARALAAEGRVDEARALLEPLASRAGPTPVVEQARRLLREGASGGV
ncbi:MAG: tetratricopeptide repeat protein [Gemmatimonadota bacterium]